MTYYLKYRPKTIDELDLASVRERLQNIVTQKKFSHAYLFSGPRGTGKTSAARLMARAAGVSPIDVLEMDAASNRGIEDIRELRERVGLSPAAGDKKAYIIDEVHMLTTEAFNALLKTLEEPPPHVIFFLCTTELIKLPATIVSRCVSIRFNKASPEEIERSLNRVIAGEKLKIEDKLIKSLSKEADGSFREIHTVLEEAALAAASDAAGADGGEILESHLISVKSFSPMSQANELTDYLVGGDSRLAIEVIEAAAENGFDMAKLAGSLLEVLHQRLIKNPSPRLLTVAKIVDEKVRSIRYAPLPQLTLEIAALELAIPGQDSEHSENSENRKVRDSENQNSRKSDSPNLRPVSPELQRGEQSDTSGSPVRDVSPNGTLRPSIPSFPKQTNSKISLETLMSKWPEILSGVRQKNHGIVTLLSHCRPTDCDDGTVNIAVKYKFHRDQLAKDRFRGMIESVASEVTGSQLRLNFILSPQTVRVLKKAPQDDNIATVGDEELIETVEELFA